MSRANQGGRLLHSLGLQGLRKVRWFEWLHHGYVVAASIGIVIVSFGGSSTAKELAYVIAFLIYFLILLIFSLASVYVYGMKARYSETLTSIHSALHGARDLYHHLDWCSEKHLPNNVKFEEAYVKSEFVRVLTSLSHAFSIVSGVKCRTSIKVIKGGDQPSEISSLYVTTLARDADSLETSRERDENECKLHLLINNTDFYSILKRDKRYFICHDVTESEHYENSTFKIHSEISKYKSTIVWPIRYVYKPKEVVAGCDQDLFGFLTVDSYSENSFNERYDVDLGAIVADSLFPIINLYWKLSTVT